MAKAGSGIAKRVTAPFIFIGTVVKPRGSTVSVVPASADVAVVRVDEALKAPPELGLTAGKRVTLRLARGPVSANETSVFYATSWIFGDGIALIEIDRTPSTPDPTALREQIAKARMAHLDDALAARIASAKLIVAGRVVQIVRASRGAPFEPDAADWHVARTIVSSVEAGTLRGSAEIEVVFPASTDRPWEHAPKLFAGQDCVLILRNGPAEDKQRGRSRRPAKRDPDGPDDNDSDSDSDRPPGYTALDPQDVQSSNQLERVRALVARGR